MPLSRQRLLGQHTQIAKKIKSVNRGLGWQERLGRTRLPPLKMAGTRLKQRDNRIFFARLTHQQNKSPFKQEWNDVARLPILTAPDRRLQQKSVPIDQVDQKICRLMDDMLETMYAAPGIGLAAPQVGVLKQVIVVDIGTEGDKQIPAPLFLANPEIIHSEGGVLWKEGCLSVPDHMADVMRSAYITLRALDRENRTVQIEATELLAVCLQHEIDHLHGTLFIDRISRLKRSIILQKLKKAKEEGS